MLVAGHVSSTLRSNNSLAYFGERMHLHYFCMNASKNNRIL
ncbi:hypothetical protein EG68_05308 [Paragonimus skrjabini miyazakii]|uniref:Uncharacterized protein n=1 Tax=Paragonimus skrjabini miyazakii TaxID=59628 RepID=A0A8S9YWS1_9TREM|nr:hypothetical protein EG68_05308 [Paragonimus skrjabini miyazakii]